MAQSHGDRLSKSLGKNLRRRGARPALLTALGVAAFLAAQQLVTGLTGLLFATTSYVGSYEPLATTGLSYSAFVLQQTGLNILTGVVPVAFGVFVSLWIVAPISDELTLRFVAARGVLAAAIGALILLLVSAVLAIAGAFTPGTIFFGGSFPWPSFNLQAIQQSVIFMVTQVVNTFVGSLPVVLLGVVLLWLWWRASERPHQVSGILDEV